MAQIVTRASLLAAFFQRFIEVFHLPPEMPEQGWYALNGVAKMLGYSSAKDARKLLPENEASPNGRAVSEAGVVRLALLARPTAIASKVREISSLAISDVLFEDCNEAARVYELCAEIRQVIDRFAPPLNMSGRTGDFCL